MRLLDLEVPLVWCDTETTGLIPKIDYIVQVACVKMYPDGREAIFSTYVKPPIAIPPEVVEVHGITDAVVKDAPTFQQIARKLADSLKLCDFGGYNASFDWRMLRAEFERCGIQGVPNGRIVDPNKIFHHHHRRNLEAALRRYRGDAEADAFTAHAHDALADIRATIEVFREQLEQHADLPRDVGALNKMFFESEDELDAGNVFYWRYRKATFGIGKHIGESLEFVAKTDASYFNWILNQDFAEDVKTIVRNARQGKFPAWKERA